MMTKMKALLCTLFGASLCLIALPASVAPVQAQGSSAKVCFKNGSAQPLYFKAVFDGVTAGGALLEPGHQFCVRNPEVMEVRVSQGRKTPVLCTGTPRGGETLELVSQAAAGNCRWSAYAN